MIFININIFNLLNLKKLRTTIHFMGSIWFIPLLSTYFFIPSLIMGSRLLKYLDQGWVEIISGQGIYLIIRKRGVQVDYFFSLNIKSYLLIFLILLIFLGFYLYLNILIRV
jgi:hypothetical protein